MNQGKIENARNRKHKLLDTSKKMLKNSQECGKKYLNFVNEVRKALKNGNQEGAMIYCVSAIRQKKFEKRCLIYSNRLESLAYRVEDAIMHHESTVGLGDTANALQAIAGLNTTDQLDGTLENLQQSTDSLTEAEIRMADLFDCNDIFSTSTTEDNQLVKELFNMLSQEHNLNEVESQVPRAPDLQSLGIGPLPDLPVDLRINTGPIGPSSSSTSTSTSNLPSL